MEELVRCTKCCVEKPTDAFYKRSDRPKGITSHCKDCIKKNTSKLQESYKNLPKGARALIEEWVCVRCDVEKPVADFYPNPSSKKGFFSTCKSCQSEERTTDEYRAKDRQRRLNNLEHHREVEAAWRDKNRDKVNASRKRYYHKNKAYEREKSARYYRENIEVERARGRQHYRDNLEYYREYEKKKHLNNPSLRTKKNGLRRARMLGAVVEGEEVPSLDILRYRDGDFCYLCFVELDFSPRVSRVWNSRGAVIEHLLPLVKGGKHVLENTALACAQCNASKGALTVDEYLERVVYESSGD